MKLFLLVLIIFTFFSCNRYSLDEPDGLVLSYEKENLVLQDTIDNYPKENALEDSLRWIEGFKKQWIRNQIIISKVTKELPNSELNIESEMIQYKADLLKFRFENYYIKNKINTQVSLNEINLFYNNNKAALRVLNVLVKSTFIEVSNTVKDRYKVRQWLASKNPRFQEKLKTYCLNNALVFDDFEGDWILLDNLKKLLDAKELRKRKVDVDKVIYVRNDSNTRYLLIHEIKNKGELMPIEYAQKEIVRLIINKRKTEIIDELNRRIEQSVEAQYK